MAALGRFSRKCSQTGLMDSKPVLQGKSRIPTLKILDEGTGDILQEINTNNGKVKTLAQLFFPKKLAT